MPSRLLSRQIDLPEEEHLSAGHLACPGCGASLSMRLALKALGTKTVIVLPACCWSIIAGPFPHSSVDVPLMHAAFETAAVSAAGVRAALDLRGEKDITVLAWAGDGGTFDIGLQALSAAAERNDDILYVCYDNEAYMNTGIQRSSATPVGAWTTTTPDPLRKEEAKKDIDAIVAAHRVPYQATATVAFPEDLHAKFVRARQVRGFRFLHLFSPCPPGWKSDEAKSIAIARIAVETGVFPLFEVEDGERYRLGAPVGALRPIRDYVGMQGRFKSMSEEEVEGFGKAVAHRVARIRALAGLG